ncbi:uncharacterized protein LOC122513163 [Polistes fuscatus]|uniref:uncharacterized protein LOC122513163 n=1 Tax=Polistes fuscatus TaxID=30207 RepID=UPI001CA80C58|nr:uncharacterized protein LOC122513163 [Polistes fuscatus]
MTNTTKIETFLLKRYEPESMDFLKWLNHFEFTVDFLNINNDVKVNFLLGKLNLKAHLYITRKVAPYDPYSLPYEELISHFEELYGLFQGKWAANYRFIMRDQFEGESVIHYINALSSMTSKVSDFYRNNDSLMGRFIHGLNNENTRNVLRSVNDLTLDNAVAIAVKLESSPVSIETD